MIEVRNPYPEWQSLAAETNCWNCYKLLWRQGQVKRHTCDECHVAGVVAAECGLTDASGKILR